MGTLSGGTTFITETKLTQLQYGSMKLHDRFSYSPFISIWRCC